MNRAYHYLSTPVIRLEDKELIRRECVSQLLYLQEVAVSVFAYEVFCKDLAPNQCR